MQPTIGRILSLLVLVISGGGGGQCSGAEGGSGVVGGGCRCAPDQWEGVLEVVEREVELRQGQMYETRSRVAVHYDFVNRRFATQDLQTGRKSLADYRLGVRVNIHRSRCRAVYSTQSMRRMCFPDSATVSNSVTVGTELAVSIWNFVEPHNATVTTTATRDTCMPIIEDVTVTDKDYSLLSTTLYTDTRIGIRDSSVFDIPKDCVFVRIPDVISTHDHNSRQKRHLSWRQWKLPVEKRA